jgi:hypothetical protein
MRKRKRKKAHFTLKGLGDCIATLTTEMRDLGYRMAHFQMRMEERLRQMEQLTNAATNNLDGMQVLFEKFACETGVGRVAPPAPTSLENANSHQPGERRNAESSQQEHAGIPLFSARPL